MRTNEVKVKLSELAGIDCLEQFSTETYAAEEVVTNRIKITLCSLVHKWIGPFGTATKC